MSRKRSLFVVAALAALAGAPPVLADTTLPLWEAGLGAGAVSFAAYRGSDRQRAYLLPVPYLVYRGELLRADREGIRGVFLRRGRLEVNLSLAASLPVDSGGDPVRRGMSDLSPTVEVGPSLIVDLWRGADLRSKVELRVPVRAAFALEGGMRHVGTVLAPALAFDRSDAFGRNWNLGMRAGPLFADAAYHGYYYDVRAPDLLPTRPLYRAGGGYSGSHVTLALSRRFDRYWVGGFVRYDDLHGAVFDDSPLVRRKSAWAAGIGLSWIFAKSAHRVGVRD